MMLRRSRSWLGFGLALVLTAPLPAGAFELSEAFADPGLAEPLAEDEMRDLRGAGVQSTWIWELDAGNEPGIPGGASVDVSEGVVRISHVGDFQGARGIFQIVQVPGDHNVVYNNLNLSLTVILGDTALGTDLIGLLGP